jgi:hypothetical protein
MIFVYFADYGDHVIPPEVVAQAKKMNDGKSLFDKRTKGARHIESYGKRMEATAAAAFGIAQNLTPNGDIIKRK